MNEITLTLKVSNNELVKDVEKWLSANSGGLGDDIGYNYKYALERVLWDKVQDMVSENLEEIYDEVDW